MTAANFMPWALSKFGRDVAPAVREYKRRFIRRGENLDAALSLATREQREKHERELAVFVKTFREGNVK